MEALDVFYPERMADRILGMGDVVSLVERAQQQFDEAEARKINKKMLKISLASMISFRRYNRSKNGEYERLDGHDSWHGKSLKGVDIDDDAFKHIEAIIGSMTPKERAQPNLLNMSRKKKLHAVQVMILTKSIKWSAVSSNE